MNYERFEKTVGVENNMNKNERKWTIFFFSRTENDLVTGFFLKSWHNACVSSPA